MTKIKTESWTVERNGNQFHIRHECIKYRHEMTELSKIRMNEAVLDAMSDCISDGKNQIIPYNNFECAVYVELVTRKETA